MVRILVQNADGRRLSYEVNLSDPIQTLKAEIEDTEGISIGTVYRTLSTLVYSGALQMNKTSNSGQSLLTKRSLLMRPKHSDHTRSRRTVLFS